MTSLNCIEYIVGIDLGNTIPEVSIAHVNDPFNIITVSSWHDLITSPQKFLSSIMYLKNENDNPLCGIKCDDVGDWGVYIDNISQYLVDIDASNEKLGQMMDGLTIEKVITDYLKYFVQFALKRLQIHDELIKSEHFQEFVKEEFIDEDIKTVSYCIVCPTDRQVFMKNCFIKAGIIEESEAEHRLSFVIKAVAAAHYHLSLDRKRAKIQKDQDYLVLDVDVISTGIAKIHTASTESLSTVTAISDEITQGSINLDIKFKAFLIENMTELNLNTSLVDQFVQKFSKHLQHYHERGAFYLYTASRTAISQEDIDGNSFDFTYEYLNRIVFKTFIESIAESVAKANENHCQCITYISGNYCIGSYFIENLFDKYKTTEFNPYRFISSDSLSRVSSGAVLSKISTYKSQTPFFLNEEYRFLFSDKKWFLPEAVLEKSDIDDIENDAYDSIVGIDFGTTFSGCSYVQLKDKSGNLITEKTIKTISEKWPGDNLNKFGKTPTLFVRDERNERQYWGEEARLQAKSHRYLNLLGNFKLFIFPESLKNFYGLNDDLKILKKQGGLAPNKVTKRRFSAYTAAINYLKLFKEHIFQHIVTRELYEDFVYIPGLSKEYKIRFVITVPAMWNASDRATMKTIAKLANIIKESEVDQLFIITEPEAAALYCEKVFIEYLNSLEGNINDANFIVCDAGAATVDVSTFNLQVNERKKSMIFQIGNSIGDICGSNSLDIKFKSYLRDFYNSFGVNIDELKNLLDDVMRDFTMSIKPEFKPDLQSDSYYNIYLPGKDFKHSTFNSNYMVADGFITLKIKEQDMKEKIFDPVFERIFTLIDDQLNQAKKGGLKIDSIFMVGGFSQSKYLQQRIKDQYEGVCHVSVPSDGVSAISLGAVSYALNPRIIKNETAEKSLSLEVQTPLDKDLTDLAEKLKGPYGDKSFEKNRLEHFVTKGQELKLWQRNSYNKNVYVVYPNAAVIAIFACDSKEYANSKYITKSHDKIMEAKIIMPHMIGIDGRLIHFKVSLHIGRTVISVTIECQDQLVNSEVQKITKHQRSSLKIMLKCSLVATGT